MEKFRIQQPIGKGGYSNVYRAINLENNQSVAIKVIKLNSQSTYLQKIINRQVKVLYACNQHPKIIKLYEVYRKNDVVYLVFQYIPMNLLNFYKKRAAKKQPVNERQVIEIMRQVCDALNFLHSNGIMHRDLKPENILIDPTTLKIKLIDFGFAKKFIEQQQTNYIVTRWYRPLQIILQLPYNKSVDIFSLGCIFLELLLSKEAFRSQSSLHQLSLICLICGYPKDINFVRKIQKLGLKSSHFPKALIFEIVEKIPKKFAQLIISMMSSTPDQRPSIQEILDHKIFKESLQISRRCRQIINFSKQKNLTKSRQPTSVSKYNMISQSAIYAKNKRRKEQEDRLSNSSLSFQNYSSIIQSKSRKRQYLNSQQRVQRSLTLSKQLKKLENQISDKYRKMKHDFNYDRESIIKDRSYSKRFNTALRNINESLTSRASTHISKSGHKRGIV